MLSSYLFFIFPLSPTLAPRLISVPQARQILAWLHGGHEVVAEAEGHA